MIAHNSLLLGPSHRKLLRACAISMGCNVVSGNLVALMLRRDGKEASKAGAALAEAAEVETLYYVQGGAKAWKARLATCLSDSFQE